MRLRILRHDVKILNGSYVNSLSLAAFRPTQSVSPAQLVEFKVALRHSPSCSPRKSHFRQSRRFRPPESVEVSQNAVLRERRSVNVEAEGVAREINPVWVGMFNVTGPRELAILDGDAGAWLSMAAQAKDAANFVARASHAMNGLGLCVVEHEDVECVEDENQLSESVSELIPEARSNAESVNRAAHGTNTRLKTPNSDCLDLPAKSVLSATSADYCRETRFLGVGCV